MPKRFVAIWFPHLLTDWHSIRNPHLKRSPLALASPDHGRMMIRATNRMASAQGIIAGMAVADARAFMPTLHILDHQSELSSSLLKKIAIWCIRYTPVAAIDAPDGILLDISGCAHLWGGEALYLKEITTRLHRFGYGTGAAIADTVGTAWAMAHFGKDSPIIETGLNKKALLPLAPAALRLDSNTLDRFQKFGLHQIGDFIDMPRSVLQRRFGEGLILRINQALGYQQEQLDPVQPAPVYEERLPCLEPIVTETGISIALAQLLETLCHRLQHEQKGIRLASFSGYRVDGKIEKIEIGTNKPSHTISHLYKLFEPKLETMEPALGIDLFILTGTSVEKLSPLQSTLLSTTCSLNDNELSELVDRLANKIGSENIHRYLPAEHYWPERSIKLATSLDEQPAASWRFDAPRPIHLLPKPEPIEVTAPVPDYPPMLFRYQGELHRISKADGPERMEQEWWIEAGSHRDYYRVEDEQGQRYWLFRAGHYDSDKSYQWFIHGFFA